VIKIVKRTFFMFRLMVLLKTFCFFIGKSYKNLGSRYFLKHFQDHWLAVAGEQKVQRKLVSKIRMKDSDRPAGRQLMKTLHPIGQKRGGLKWKLSLPGHWLVEKTG